MPFSTKFPDHVTLDKELEVKGLCEPNTEVTLKLYISDGEVTAWGSPFKVLKAMGTTKGSFSFSDQVFTITSEMLTKEEFTHVQMVVSNEGSTEMSHKIPINRR